MEDLQHSRRKLLGIIPLLGVAIVTGAPVLAVGQKEKGMKEEEEQEVSANEDLMREHGILKRVLLVYEEIIRRAKAGQDFSPQAITDAATVIRKFIEGYHEKLEEEHLFPRFRKAGKLVNLVDTLLTQHQAGRRVTDRVLAMAGSLKTKEDRNKVADELRSFIRMYAPHEAREDTVLFPELHTIVSPHEYDALGEQFEGIERKTFGGDGFDIYDIYDLSQFTPR
jgi:hemerythrin-like domain-containing protein